MTIVQIKVTDFKEIMSIYNYYVQNTLLTFSNTNMGVDEVIQLINDGIQYAGFVALENTEIIGFGIAYPFRPEAIFNKTVKFTYFLNPNYTGKGIGTKIFKRLYSELKEKGFTEILVNISSLNESSIKFHKKIGFTECGFFKNIGEMKGKKISMIWMQMQI